MPPAKQSYTASDMTILEGLAHVRKRPGMYIGGTGISGLHHLVWEVVDNSVDEAMAGYCDRIDITLLADGGCRVADDGRGIPIDVHPEFKMTGVEIVLTKLHGGGKFGGDGYKVSGGLHGVGVSVVNALSEQGRGRGRSRRQAPPHRVRRGRAKRTKLEVVGESPRGRTGTTVTFWPDPTIFESTEFVARTLLERFQMMAFLNKALEIRFQDERPEHDTEPVVYKYADGIVDFVKHVNATKNAAVQPGRLPRAGRGGRTRSRSRSSGTRATRPTACTASPTASPPSRAARTRRASARRSPPWSTSTPEAKGLLKEKDENLPGEDIREGLTAIISVRLREPQFEGQTKGKLGNPEIKTLVQKATNEKLADWLEEHPTEANKIVKKAHRRGRGPGLPPARPATPPVASRALDGAGMPDKLQDCSSREPRASASCSSSRATPPAARPPAPATRGSRRSCPIRGKILNVERARLDKMLKNNEIQALISAIGAGVGARSSTSRRSATTR